jgi:hypothetical protein
MRSGRPQFFLRDPSPGGSFYPINWKEIQIIGNKFHIIHRADFSFTSIKIIKVLSSRGLEVCGLNGLFREMWGLRIAW